MILRRGSVTRIGKTAVVLTIALGSLSLVSGIGDAAGVVFGGAFQVANLHLIRALVSQLIAGSRVVGTGLSSILLVKILALYAILGIALTRLPIDPLSFLVGTGALFLAILLEGLLLGEPVEDVPGEQRAEQGES